MVSQNANIKLQSYSLQTKVLHSNHTISLPIISYYALILLFSIMTHAQWIIAKLWHTCMYPKFKFQLMPSIKDETNETFSINEIVMEQKNSIKSWLSSRLQ